MQKIGGTKKTKINCAHPSRDERVNSCATYRPGIVGT